MAGKKASPSTPPVSNSVRKTTDLAGKSVIFTLEVQLPIQWVTVLWLLYSTYILDNPGTKSRGNWAARDYLMFTTNFEPQSHCLGQVVLRLAMRPRTAQTTRCQSRKGNACHLNIRILHPGPKAQDKGSSRRHRFCRIIVVCVSLWPLVSEPSKFKASQCGLLPLFVGTSGMKPVLYVV